MNEKLDHVPLNPAFRGGSVRLRCISWPLVASVFVLLFLGHSYGREWEDSPKGQPEQMQSPVDYCPKLTDPFFESNERSYWEGSRGLPDRGMFAPGEVLRRFKHTAKCFSTSRGVRHKVRFCEARFVGVNMIDLFIHESNPAFDDGLRVDIRNGTFTCQFWTLYLAGPTKGLMWTTKRQKLSLDKRTYWKGDVIKGRIDLEVLDELIDPKYPERRPRRIMLYGVFKTIVE